MFRVVGTNYLEALEVSAVGLNFQDFSVGTPGNTRNTTSPPKKQQEEQRLHRILNVRNITSTWIGSFPLAVTVTIVGKRRYHSSLRIETLLRSLCA